MASSSVNYIINVQDAMHSAPVQVEDAKYFTSHIVPNLQSLSDDDYQNGPAVILHSLARSSYILYRKDVYWCAEWDPGLIVVHFTHDAKLAWGAFRSPIPEFGGREPLAEDEEHFDENSPNHQYNLVFRAWDSQFDTDYYKRNLFEPAAEQVLKQFRTALKHVESLGEELRLQLSDSAEFKKWSTLCEKNLAKWAGEGIRDPRK